MGQKQSYGVSEESSASAAVEKEGCVATSVDATCTPSKVIKLSTKTNTQTDSPTASAPVHKLHRTEPPDDIPVENSPKDKSISDGQE
ncbi:hypothetical protein Tcan_18330 [Toxocara canis]|uniref:Uncharacterized protein n=2 Tax=Toxocara canis TaxID=6265 RepID=A0A0B2V938_TOXCA|nr:hypothetical protein Tcan_18330 [Toxocara canis]VDM42372.1 unnamed protein product [Toxocara canis]